MAGTFVQSFGIPCPSTVDRDGRVLLSDGNIAFVAVPSTMIVDRDDKIAATR